MTVTQYIGARYVPLFAGDWDSTQQYEPLSIVLYQGNSYTSIQAVPTGIAITNTEYWAQTGNYNAQVEAYRQEVRNFDTRLIQAENDISAEETAREAADTALSGDIAAETTAREAADTALSNDMTELETSVNATIDEFQTQVNTELEAMEEAVKGKMEVIKGANVVCIGDSYGRGVGGNADHGWCYFLSEWGRCASITNISNSGAGFIAEGHSTGLENLTFADQINIAKNSLPSGVTQNDVDIVIVAGGYNDHGQSGQYGAAYSTMRAAQNAFPNATIHFYPLCAGDRQLNNEYVSSYMNLCHGAAETGCQVHSDALYWLYPFEIQTSYGDNIHPNNAGYRLIAAFMLGTINGGTYLPNTELFAATAEGFSFAPDATNQNFRAFVQNGVAYFGGRIDRVGEGPLCTLPSYCRPRATTYYEAFVYGGTGLAGLGRLRVLTDGTLEFYNMDSGTYDSTATYQVYIPCISMPLGHVIF